MIGFGIYFEGRVNRIYQRRMLGTREDLRKTPRPKQLGSWSCLKPLWLWTVELCELVNSLYLCQLGPVSPKRILIDTKDQGRPF